MYGVERRQWILDRARADGRVDVGEVSHRLGVASETVRRDLSALDRHGLVHRVHGGAVPIDRLGYESQLTLRAARRQSEKQRIAAAALARLPGLESVYLDEGSSVQFLAEMLHPERPLTVVTSSVVLAAVLAPRPQITVLVLGGRVRGLTLATVEHWAVDMLGDLVLDAAVLGTNGLSAEHGCTCPDAAVAAVKSAALRASRSSILLADHTKFGADSFCAFARWRDIDTVITDRGAAPDQIQSLRALGCEVEVV